MSKLDKRAISTLVIAIFLLSMISVLPIAEAAIIPVTVTADPDASGELSDYTVSFTTVGAIVADTGTITITFPAEYDLSLLDPGVPATPFVPVDIIMSVGGITYVPSAIVIVAGTVTITAGLVIPAGPVLVSTSNMHLKNPTSPAVYTINVATSAPDAGSGAVTIVQATGTLDITATPSGGAVSVDGYYCGPAPLLKVVDVGTYTVSFGAIPGYITPPPVVKTVGYTENVLIDVTYAEIPPTTGFSIDSVSAIIVDYAKVLKVTGSGVTAGTEVKIFWDYAYGTYAHLLNTTEGKPDATFECDIKVPSDVGGFHFLWATDTATGETVSFGPLTMMPKIKLKPSSGLEGDPVTVTGYGFSADSEVTITFSTIIAPLTTTVETDELGYFAYNFDVPKPDYATYQVIATDDKGYTASAEFTIGASLSLDVEEGPEGTVIEVSGIGFGDGQVITGVNWGGTPIPLVGDAVTVPLSGKFTLKIVVPSTGEGDRTIMIKDNDPALTEVDVEFTVDGVATIEVEPTYGAPGATIELKGYNFTQIADTVVKLTLTSTEHGPTSLGEVKTKVDGTFETTFTSPAVTFANYKVEAVDEEYLLSASDPFKVGMIAMIINPVYGPSGSDVSLTGVGYAEGDFNMTFGEVLYEFPNGVSSTEIIAKTFYVPTLDPGTYDVTVVDEVGNELTAQFMVTAKTEVIFEPTQAPNKYNVVIKGYHFTEEEYADLEFILYNSTESWDITPDVYEYDSELTDPFIIFDSAELDADGNFSAWWPVPLADEISLGDYTLNVTAGDTFIQAPFSIVTARVDVAPRKALFDRGDTIQFNVKNDFDFKESYMKIWDPYDNLYWQTEDFEVWLKVGNLYTVPYYLQTSGKNPMILSQDAPLGIWFYVFYETGTTQLTNGTFTVGPSAAAQVEEKLTEIWASMEDLSTDIDSITDEISDDIDALSGEMEDVVADVQDMVDDITADLAEELAGVAADTEAAVGELEGAIGDIASAQNELDSKLDDMGQDTAAAKQAAEDAQESTQGLTTIVYGAIACSLIAALAAVVSLMQISKKIA